MRIMNQFIQVLDPYESMDRKIIGFKGECSMTIIIKFQKKETTFQLIVRLTLVILTLFILEIIQLLLNIKIQTCQYSTNNVQLSIISYQIIIARCEQIIFAQDIYSLSLVLIILLKLWLNRFISRRSRVFLIILNKKRPQLTRSSSQQKLQEHLNLSLLTQKNILTTQQQQYHCIIRSQSI